MNQKIAFLFSIFFIISSCKELSPEKVNSDQFEFYADNDNLIFKKRIIHKDYDSLYYFYRNRELFKKGKIHKNGRPHGIWNLYSNSGQLREIREWFYLEGHSRLNRAWFLNKKGDTIEYRIQDSIFDQKEYVNDTLGTRETDYNHFQFNKDTIYLNEPFRAIAVCNSPRLSNYNSQTRLFLHTESEEFNIYFPNDSIIRKMEFKNLETDTINQKWFPNVKTDRYKYVTTFGCYFKNPGNKLLRGYMEEYAIGPFKDFSSDSITARTYFEKRIYVKDTIN
ncbi:MAG: hypothetical protein ACSHWW_09500 [Nonlabens sp.]|uniref:hypothetical protein n=1 Tax=Nonlabens sp. TaxID=1888209 RepID=UPI003EF726AE